MPKSSKEKNLAKLTTLLGPAPVLTSESLREYNEVWTRFIECAKPRDFIEEIFIRDAADATWDARRFALHKNLLIEREHKRLLEIETKRHLEVLKREARIAEGMAERAKKAEHADVSEQAESVTASSTSAEPGGDTQTTTEDDQAAAPATIFDRWLELEEEIDNTLSDIRDILHSDPDEVDHAKALQAGIVYYEQLDRLHSIAIARRNDALEQLDFYRQGLGQRLRSVSDEIIEADFTETVHDAPSLAGPGSDGDTQ